MDSVIRAVAAYVILFLLFRTTGKRALAEITAFDTVLLLIIAEAVGPALLQGDESMTNALLVVTTLLVLDVGLSLLNVRSRRADKLLNDVPLVLLADGQVLTDRLRKERVTEDDILEQARLRFGIETLGDIRFAILERSGAISVIPHRVPWAPATGGTS